MIIKCKGPQCDFRFVSTKDRLNELVKEKVEHEALTGHNVVFLLALGSRLVEKDNPSNVYKARCFTCWENKALFVIYETISKLDAQRYIDVHNTNMAKKEKNTYQEHFFEIKDSPYASFAVHIADNSPLIQKMRLDNIETSQINMQAKELELGNQELAFFLKSAGAKNRETRIAYNLYKNTCPICQYFQSISSDDYQDKERLAELEEKKYDIMLSHVRQNHHIVYDSYQADPNTTENILQMCILYQRNLYNLRALAHIHTTREQRKKKSDKMAQALRTLNKTGIPYVLLTSMFEIDTATLGKKTYRGMEILGKPEWVQNLESNE